MKKIFNMETLKKIVNIEGYWRENNMMYLPKISGIYFVYENIHNKIDDTIILKKLLYIGDSEDIREHINNQSKIDDWKNYISLNSELTFACAPIENKFRSRIVSAYICSNKPILNSVQDFNFQFEKTILISFGSVRFIEPVIEIENNFDKSLYYSNIG
jgi:hypothetical protein